MLNKKRLIKAAFFALLFGASAIHADLAPTKQAQESGKNDEIDLKKLSETFGNFIGRNLKNPGLSFDVDSLIQGIRDGTEGKPAPLSEKDYEAMMAKVQEKVFKEMSEKNLKVADEFLAKNAKEGEIKEIVPGKLQYKIEKEGTGAVVEPHSSPKIHYTGKYENGTVFGTSTEMGGPITIPLDQTIPGFSKGIVGMKEGEKRLLFVHPDLGYGTSGQLPPNELLIFEIEVVKANSDDAKDGAKETASADNSSDDSSDDEDLFFDDEDEDEGKDKQPSSADAKKGAPSQAAIQKTAATEYYY